MATDIIRFLDDDFMDVFSCGGGAALGAQAAGLKPRFGLEYDASLGEWYNHNLGPHCVIANILGFDFTALTSPFWFHASPPCVTASNANQRSGETEHDINLASAVCDAIRALRPVVFSLENVSNYQNYVSFAMILVALTEQGYSIIHAVLDAADFGVAQNRKRLIVVARRDRYPRLPVPTHTNPTKLGDGSQLTMLPLIPWRGWLDAVKHRVAEFTPSAWAPWQIPRLPQEVQESFLVGGGNNSLEDAAPGRGVRSANEPSCTITATTRGKMTAFLMHGGNSGANGDRFRFGDEPSFTVTASQRVAHRAYLVSGNDGTTRNDSQPAFTVCASFGAKGTIPRAGIEGHVVKLSIGALADLQSFPTSYQLPPAKVIAGRLIGNAVPPLLMQRVVEANI